MTTSDLGIILTFWMTMWITGYAVGFVQRWMQGIGEKL